MSGESPRSRLPDERLRALVEAIPLALFEVGLDGTWSFANDRFRQVLGLPAGETLAEGLTRLIDPSDRDEVVARWQGATRVGEPFQVEFRLVASGGGTPRRIRARAAPLRSAGGELAGYAGVLEDVSEDRRLERALLEETEAERERSRRKSEFLAVMSHELRTPIHGVVGTAALLQSTQLSAEQREYVEMLAHSADATLSVVNNVLDLSKIEAGKLELEMADFDLREIVEKAVSLFAARAHGKGIDLSCNLTGRLPPRFHGDGERLRQVLVNLLSNSVKFTEKGEVVLTVRPADGGRAVPGIWRFEVRDSGIGISDGARGRLFAPFAQADPSVSRRFGGTGLGLTICQQLVKLMDGAIGVDSVAGKGSTFWFTARLGPAAGPPPAADPVPEEIRGRRVLVVDDHAATREAVGELLRSFDDMVLEAPGGKAGLEALRKGAADYEPVDVVLVDMHLPGDGEARALVEGVRRNADLENVRVILLTSFGHKARAEAAKWEGIAAFLAKPVRRSDLVDCLAAAFAEDREEPFGRLARPRAPAVSLTGSFRLARILVVDDNEVNRKIARRQLEQKGFLVETACDGREAVDMVAKTPYDLIFMDWMMPEMDGFEATRRIREREKTTGARVPIVAMTARAMEGDREKCMEPGMDDYMTKPVRIDEMDAILERWLAPRKGEESGAHALAAAAAAATSGAPAPAPVPARKGEEPPVDPAVLDSLAALQGEGDADIVAELVGIFTREMGPRFERLERAVADDDPETLMREAHGIKGTSLSIGAAPLAAIARVLEEGGHNGSVEGAEAHIRDLRNEYVRVAAALEARLRKS